MKVTWAVSGPSFQSLAVGGGKREISVGPGVGRMLTAEQVAGALGARAVACAGCAPAEEAAGAVAVVGKALCGMQAPTRTAARAIKRRIFGVFNCSCLSSQMGRHAREAIARPF